MAAPKPGGFKMSLGGLKAKPGLKAALLQKDAKRPRLALGDDEPDDTNKQQEISGWDAAEGGALDASGKTEQKKGPLVIPVLPNRNWRENAQRKQHARGAPQQPQAQDGDTVEKMEETKVQYGLNIVKKKEELQAALPVESGEAMDTDEKDGLTEEQRLEKKALDALLSGKSADDEHVIPIQTEEEAFHNDLRDAPEAPTLEAYEATPIEGFGAALLRGMGWKDGEAIGRNGIVAKPKEVKRRPALLGIGAKEEAAVGIELGAWGNKGKGKGKQNAPIYNPVTLRNKHTGETITEEELKAKLESQDMVQEEKPQKVKSRYDDEEEDERRRERRHEKRDDRDRRRGDDDDDYDSERRREKDRRDERRRDRDSDYYHDSDRRRDKRREKDRDDDYDSERRSSKREDRDRRYRSRSPDDRRDKKRDRDRFRSRSRDSEDRRDKRRERDRDRDRDRRERSRSRDSEERRKRRRDREEGYSDERGERKRSYRK